MPRFELILLGISELFTRNIFAVVQLKNCYNLFVIAGNEFYCEKSWEAKESSVIIYIALSVKVFFQVASGRTQFM